MWNDNTFLFVRKQNCNNYAEVFAHPYKIQSPGRHVLGICAPLLMHSVTVLCLFNNNSPTNAQIFIFTNILVGISCLLGTDSIATKCMLESPYASFDFSQWCSHGFLVSGTWCFSAIRRSFISLTNGMLVGAFSLPMKRFGLYKTLFKPYVKLLHFLHKSTYEVLNRNIGFYLHKNSLFFIQT